MNNIQTSALNHAQDYSNLALTDEEVRMVLETRQRSAERIAKARTVVLVVNADTPALAISETQRTIFRMAPDRVKVLSLHPFDVRDAAYWPEVKAVFDATGLSPEVDLVTDDQVKGFGSSGNVTVLRA